MAGDKGGQVAGNPGKQVQWRSKQVALIAWVSLDVQALSARKC
jgi:hypothetical protein